MNLSNDRRIAAAVAFVLLTSCWAIGAAAQEADPKAEALRLYKIGRLHFEGDEFEKAAGVFEKALALDPDPILAYNADRARERMGELAQAPLLYARSLEMAPDGDVADRCTQAIASIDRQTEAQAEAKREREEERGTIDVHSDVTGQVRIDGKLMGTAPGRFRVDPGHRTVEVSRAGAAPFSTKVDIVANEVADVTAVLEFTRAAPVNALGWTGFGMMAAGVGAGAIGLGLADENGLGTGGGIAVASAVLLEVAGIGLVAWSQAE